MTLEWQELTIAAAALALAALLARQLIATMRAEIRDLRKQRDRLTVIVEKHADTLRQLSQHVNEFEEER